MSNSNATSASSSDYDDGLAFRFKLPRVDHSLRSVSIKDGVPELHFSRYLKVPTITEEDVATCVRLCLDNKRPEFFYMRFLPDHPFAVTGRHYKCYKPAYLKGTSVGELLAEVDWKMKCLHVGVRSDENKDTFSSWAESSKHPGLKTLEDFPNNFKGSSQVFMTCESVDVNEHDDTLSFVGEPKMKIDWFDEESSSPYSKYISSNFDSIAYHDEPLFLKMKEIVKLMLAVEWLRDRGVKFSEEWVKQSTNKASMERPKPLAVEVSEEEKDRIMKRLEIEAEAVLAKHATIPKLHSKYSSKVSVKDPVFNNLFSGFELKLEKTVPCPFFEALTDLYVPVVVSATARATFNDFDFLYQDLDPNIPVSYDPESKELVIPEVKSWSDLFRETMPFPCTWVQHPTNPNLRTPPVTGGVTTSNIPVRRTERVNVSESVSTPISVQASKSRKCQKKISPVTEKGLVQVCPSAMCVDTSGYDAVRGGGTKQYGYTGSTSSFASKRDGTPIKQQPSLYSSTNMKSTIGGQIVSDQYLFANLSSSPTQSIAIDKGSPTDSGYCSVESTPQGSQLLQRDAVGKHVGELFIDTGEIPLPPASEKEYHSK